LDGKFRGNGDEHLTVCALGADEQYYARWTDGSWSCYAYDTTVTMLKEVVKKSKKKADCDIKAVALGYGTSYLISYGSSRKLRYRCDLKNYYPQLQQFLEAEKPLNILVSFPRRWCRGHSILRSIRPLRSTRAVKPTTSSYFRNVMGGRRSRGLAQTRPSIRRYGRGPTKQQSSGGEPPAEAGEGNKGWMGHGFLFHA
jgi:hypothetical protein